ncbi:hypothetical protein Nepgr_007769 [Nepenthes gracilis]|uniref:Protein SCAI n=1 Tax=Nepenthes gracilis TaxID=150966 RepID=A0AAD3S7S4_NEPGR|nr:hypothetical protein Nepgr_007769 [Nepenthes gracilis]
MATDDDVPKTFHALVETADRKFARVRDVPAYGRSPNHYFHKVFKAYMRLWKYQQENRAKLVESGLQRWEIGEIASRIGQLYFGQYMRTSEARFLLESYVFYEAILNRGYFQGSKGLEKDLSVRYKNLRFYARFLLVSLLLNRHEMVRHLVDKFKALLDDCRVTFRETNLKEWKQVLQEIVRFTKADASLANARPLRYCATFDTHPDSLPYVARFHAKKVLKLHDAILTSYHRNEVKFAELTLDTYRMLQCLEWEPSGSFYQKRPVESTENGRLNDYSGTSGLIDINLAVDLTDPTLPPNPRKAILYRPTVTHLIAVIATICEELPPDSIMLIYVSSTGTTCLSSDSHGESSGGSRGSAKIKVVPQASNDQNSSPECHDSKMGYLRSFYESHLLLGPRGLGGSTNFCPGDLIPFTRRPLFLVIDSDTSFAFKVLHGDEQGEPAALLLSPSRPSFKSPSRADVTQSGSQFTFFLTAPLQAFCQLVGLSFPDREKDVYDAAESIISNAFSKWEVILCTSTTLDLVWAQVLSDPFLRRLILRFIFCRAVLSLFHSPEDCDGFVPVCLPLLPSLVLPESEVVRSSVLWLADHLQVSSCFSDT